MSTWTDKGVVVTGAARGIGRAIAERLHAEGARLVVADILSDPLAETASALDAFAVSGDCSSDLGARRLVDRAQDHLGQIDCFIGNAGIARGEGLDGSSDDDWADSWEVNVMAHVRATRLLLPGWLERGEGRYVLTASAAGLLTILGQPTYAVTKHGAEAYAEWLAATYGHRGVKVHAICPQGVLTDMYPGTGDGGLADVIGHDGALPPAAVADALIAAVEADEFLVLPHPEVRNYFAYRGTKTDSWLRSMQKLQQRLDESAPDQSTNQ
ncbi:SDR family oxidoreductase [Demetria terragena]|uniref:SDR family oxidoreductase n=1 Tax=Demetria terragena TaxID=63959 RepID=UPI0003A55C5F|nr:SDR family oxidoreductase [Demetria terragena]